MSRTLLALFHFLLVSVLFSAPGRLDRSLSEIKFHRNYSLVGTTFINGSCKSVSDGKCYVIIVLVVSLLLGGQAATHVRIVYVVAKTTHTNLHSYSIT